MHICCAGEVMVELAGGDHAGIYRQGFAGDSFNTAIYLVREGLKVDYMSRLGDDPFSNAILAELVCEGIGTKHIQQVPDRQPGLYLINNTADGEREFRYWRANSPARELFDSPVAQLPCEVFYFTGITLAVTRTGIENLKTLLQQLVDGGAKVVFDPNYRPVLWRDHSQAREYYQQVLPYCHLVLPTLEDETALWDIATPEACAQMYRDYGITEIAIKGTDLIAHAYCDGKTAAREADKVVAVDTTGAGDSFNAAYLAARLRGEALETALLAGQRLAAVVVQHRGALLPRPATQRG